MIIAAHDGPIVGRCEPIAPGVQRLLAPNPSPMTGPGTNSYVIGHGPFVVVDPAVDDDAHLDALMQATGGAIEAIWLTHRHPDHAGGAAALAARSGATIHAWPKPVAGAHDLAVTVDAVFADGQRLTAGGLSVIVYHAPGHAADCVVFELVEAGLLLAGDTLMADVTVVILPPDGDMTAYFDTLERLAGLAIEAITAIAPGHGRLLHAPAAEIARVIAHRREREIQIADCLSPEAARTAEAIVAVLYPDLDERLVPVAAAQVTAHLERLVARGRALAVAGGWRASR